MLGLLVLFAYFAGCINTSKVDAIEDFAVGSVQQFRYSGYVVEAPPSQFLKIQDVPQKHIEAELSTNIVELYAILGLHDSTVVDVFSGWGISYFPLVEAVGLSGVIVAIEVDHTHFNCLRNNSMDKIMWERTLLVHGDPRETKVGLRTTHSVSNVVKRIGLDCPRLIRINEHADLHPDDVFYALLGGISLISSCRPIVLLDCRREDPSTATAMAEFFSALGGGTGTGAYSMHWIDVEHTLEHVSPSTERSTSKWAEFALLAVPVELVSLEAQLRSLGMLKLNQYIESYQGNMWDDAVAYMNRPVLASAGLTESSSDNDGTSHFGASEVPPVAHDPDCNKSLPITMKESAEVVVYLRNIADPESALAVLLGDSPGSASDAAFKASLVSERLDKMTLLYRFSSGSSASIENLRKVAMVHCSAWLQRLNAHAETLHRATMEELSAGAQACPAFVEKRLRTIRRLLTLRALTLTNPRLVLDPKASTDSFFPGPQREPVAASGAELMYYQLREGQSDIGPHEGKAIVPGWVMGSWFAHAPFETKSDEAACGEPIWCDHTLEMQRRIVAWQNPEKYSAPADPAADFSSRSTPRTGRDWSAPAAPRPRSCASAKFLVYEPISNKQGIGALLELVAVTMRYAICLDRILIINFVDQEPTLQKWLHPGCQGSFLECYFQPVSSCSLSAEEVKAARSSQDGYEFDAYPQREERVLVLKGMPLEGKCTLCYSEWLPQSRFFDGLIVGEGSFNGSDKGHLMHAAAFRSSIKQTWASQFLRYLMRPRLWLQEAVAQIVHFSMQSPAPETVNMLTDRTNQSYLSVNSFPRSFLSLHVRFGMKAAENALKPLSRYMDFVARKMPYVQDIFLSTETEAVIWALQAEYPEYRFHVLHYPRKEFLDLGLAHQHIAYHQSTDYVDEMLFSLANLYVASEAQGFVGTLSSNWCTMIMHLERTRGDGGYEYYSMDEGSAHTTCF